jgi:hypothetical protein
VWKMIIELLNRKNWLSLRMVSKRLYALCKEVQVKIQKETIVFLFIWQQYLCGHGERYYLIFSEIPQEIKVRNWDKPEIWNESEYRKYYSIIRISLCELQIFFDKNDKRINLFTK